MQDAFSPHRFRRHKASETIVLCFLQGGKALQTNSLVFENNYALNSDVVGMPTIDMSVEFWARTPAYNESSPNADKKFEDMLNYASRIPDAEGEFYLLLHEADRER